MCIILKNTGLILLYNVENYMVNNMYNLRMICIQMLRFTLDTKKL